jgi:multicomponent Na+:H+ antiporter subunit A
VTSGPATERPEGGKGVVESPPPSLILETGVGALFHTALLFSLFLLFAGHNAPGGGFVGGLVAGAAFVLRYVEGGAGAVDRAAPFSSHALIGSGLTVAVGTGVASWLGGGQFLESAKVTLDLPVLGTVKTTSALVFDIGVYLVVVGLVIGVLTTLGDQDGDEADPHAEAVP